MQTLLPAVVFILAVAVAVNLTLTMAIVRKLRASGDSNHDHASTAWASPALPTVGSRLRSFQVTDTDGAVVTEADLARKRSLLVLLSASCKACRTVATQLSQAAAPDVGARLAILIDEGDASATAELAELLPAGLRRAHGDVPMAESLGVTGFPAVLVIADGVITQAAHSLAPVQLERKLNFA